VPERLLDPLELVELEDEPLLEEDEDPDPLELFEELPLEEPDLLLLLELLPLRLELPLEESLLELLLDDELLPEDDPDEDPEDDPELDPLPLPELTDWPDALFR
jgi:hypothetical protein